MKKFLKIIIIAILTVSIATGCVKFSKDTNDKQGKNISEESSYKVFSEWIWKKKRYVSVKLKEPSDRFETQRQEWIGVQKIGKDTFEWDDINISHLMGDTIIDLGNTVLPNEQNTIMIRKGIGRIRVIVPIGVGVKLSHNAFIGEAKFDGQQLELKNETITMYSERFESSHKKINIISSVLVGEIEVIEA